MSKREELHLNEDDFGYSVSLCYDLETEAGVLRDFKSVLSSCIKELARRGGAHCTYATPDELEGFMFSSKEFSTVNFSLDKIRQLLDRLDAVSTEDASFLRYRIILGGPVLKPFTARISMSEDLEVELAFLRRCLG